MHAMPPDFVFTFHPDQRKRFRDGSLIAHWTARYPELFDQDDVRLLQTEHQRKYHFFEWLSAVLLFEATGYLSLVESYTSATHPMKLSRFREVVGEDVFHWARANESGQPDLFVYRPRSDDWFFCEVKGGHDRIRDNQKKWIEDFCAVDKYRKVRVIHLIEYKSR